MSEGLQQTASTVHAAKASEEAEQAIQEMMQAAGGALLLKLRAATALPVLLLLCQVYYVSGQLSPLNSHPHLTAANSNIQSMHPACLTWVPQVRQLISAPCTCVQVRLRGW